MLVAVGSPVARRILLPVRIPFLSGLCNGLLANLWGIRQLCLTYWIVARPQPVFSVERMRGIDRLAIDLDAEPRTVRNRDFAIPDLQWLPR